MQVGLNLRKRRESKKMSQSEVAFLVGTSQSTYFTWESGEQVNIRMKYIPKLIEVLGLTINELIPESATLKIEDNPEHDSSIKEPINFTSNAHVFIDEITNVYRKMIVLLEEKVSSQNQIINQLETELNNYRKK